MKIDCTTVIKNIDSTDAKDEAGRPLTLGVVAALALNRPEGADPIRRGMLAMRMYGAGKDFDLSPEDAALIREGLAAMWTPIVAAQAHALLEG